MNIYLGTINPLSAVEIVDDDPTAGGLETPTTYVRFWGKTGESVTFRILQDDARKIAAAVEFLDFKRADTARGKEMPYKMQETVREEIRRAFQDWGGH